MRALLVGIFLEGVLQTTEVLSLTAKEVVAGSTEALEDLYIHLLRCKADGLPLCLQLDNLLCVAFPVAAALVLLGSDSLYLLAERCLLGEVVLLLGTQVFEVLLVALIDDSRRSLEAVPYFLAQLAGYGTSLAILLMQLLQLVEGTDDICLFSQLLCSLAKLGLDFQVLLEVIFTCLAVQLQQVVELLHIQLVVTPQFVGLLCWHVLDFFPLFLQGFEVLIRLVSLLRGGYHGLYLLDDGELLLQVLLLLLLLLAEQLLTLFLDNTHLGLEGFLLWVGCYLVLFWVATTINIFLEGCFTFGNMQLVEDCLQVVDLVFLGSLVAVSNLTDTL